MPIHCIWSTQKGEIIITKRIKSNHSCFLCLSLSRKYLIFLDFFFYEKKLSFSSLWIIIIHKEKMVYFFKFQLSTPFIIHRQLSTPLVIDNEIAKVNLDFFRELKQHFKIQLSHPKWDFFFVYTIRRRESLMKPVSP